MQDLTARLAALFARCRVEVMLPESDVADMMEALRPLTAADLRAVAIGAGVASPERGKRDLLRRIEGKLRAGERTMAQTWC